MRTRFLPALLSFLFIISVAKAQQTDAIDLIATYFSNGDAPKIAYYFSSALELNILTEENLYSKAQAEQILRDFFSKNKPISVKVIHRLTSNPNYKIAVLSMVTATNKFRIAISLNNNEERFTIKEIRIESDKQ